MRLANVQEIAGPSAQAHGQTAVVEASSVKRDLLSIADLAGDEILRLLTDAARLKQATLAGTQNSALSQKTLVMIFEKPSLRTRVSFETGMTQLGGHAIYLAREDIGMGTREPVKDVARVLSRMGNLLMARTFSHATVEDLARYSRVPVINGLSDREHPCQILADLLTMREYKGKLRGLRVAYFGDSENNITHSLALAAGLLGMQRSPIATRESQGERSRKQRTARRQSATPTWCIPIPGSAWETNWRGRRVSGSFVPFRSRSTSCGARKRMRSSCTTCRHIVGTRRLTP